MNYYDEILLKIIEIKSSNNYRVIDEECAIRQFEFITKTSRFDNLFSSMTDGKRFDSAFDLANFFSDNKVESTCIMTYLGDNVTSFSFEFEFNLSILNDIFENVPQRHIFLCNELKLAFVVVGDEIYLIKH